MSNVVDFREDKVSRSSVIIKPFVVMIPRNTSIYFSSTQEEIKSDISDSEGVKEASDNVNMIIVSVLENRLMVEANDSKLERINRVTVLERKELESSTVEGED